MPDYDLDEINAAFGRMCAETITQVRPDGIAAARGLARRRRNVRVAGLAVIVLLVISAPVVFTVSGHRGRPAASPSGLQTTGRAHFIACPAIAIPAPAGGITQRQFCDATMSLPPWTNGDGTACPSGPHKFGLGAADPITFGPTDGDEPRGLLPVAYTSALGDRKVDMIVQVNCESGDPQSQILALRSTPTGQITTVGQVVATGSTIYAFAGFQVRADGDIAVTVADSDDLGLAQTQVRTYRWNGSTFVQVAGPTTFPTNPKLPVPRIAASDLTLAKDAHGKRSGTLFVTVNEEGYDGPIEVTVDVDPWVKFVDLPAKCRASISGEAGNGPQEELVCDTKMTSGQIRHFEFHATAPAGGGPVSSAEPFAQASFAGPAQGNVIGQDTTTFKLILP